ncbi:MAG: hypothetical protein IJ087_04185, partial [Eggerthellaceae bacterium]|nr:hypothetical protein [Eggerthellaceae bacterium]
MAHPTERAFAWSSWTNATSGMLKKIGMGDCVHEDLVQISYARIVRRYDGKTSPESLLNPWAGKIDSKDAHYATIAGDRVYAGKDKTFESADKLAELLYRENLAYLRIGSFWNDAAANELKDFTYSCARPNNIPKFSGSTYQGAWDVGTHIRETSVANKNSMMTRGLDALVQFTMNDRNNFIHGMLTSQADLSKHLTQEEVKRYALQWLSVAYESARTGKVSATSDGRKQISNGKEIELDEATGLKRAQQIFEGFIDTYAQLADEDNNDLSEDEKFGMNVSLQVGSSEASIPLPHRRLRLRALGMLCHTLEDVWCPAHTCRAYRTIDGKKYPILAFSNYKLQNGDKAPMFGYHIPFDRYAISDVNNSPANWREAFTRGIKKTAYVGTETLGNALSYSMNDIENAHTLFNTLGMNETIECITKLFDFMYKGTAWDDGVRKWVDEEVMPTYFNAGDSYICDAGRRSLHTPTYLMAPIQAMKRAYNKAGLSENYKEALGRAQSYDDWQRGAHLFYSGKYNTGKSKAIPSAGENDPYSPDTTGESLLEALVETLHKGYSSLKTEKEAYDLLAKIGANGCYGMVTALGRVSGMLQEFSIELTGKLRSNDDAYMKKISDLRDFYGAGLRGGVKLATQSSKAPGLLTAGVAYADDGSTGGGDFFTTSNMALEDYVSYDDGSYSIAVRDMDSLDTMVMLVPADTPGKEKLNEGVANLTISYTADTEFRDDPDCCYIVSEIDASSMDEGVVRVTGTVKAVSADK